MKLRPTCWRTSQRDSPSTWWWANWVHFYTLKWTDSLRPSCDSEVIAMLIHSDQSSCLHTVFIQNGEAFRILSSEKERPSRYISLVLNYFIIFNDDCYIIRNLASLERFPIGIIQNVSELKAVLFVCIMYKRFVLLIL